MIYPDTFDRYPEIGSIMGGALDDGTKINPRFSVWCPTGQPWIRTPEGIACFEEPGRYVWPVEEAKSMALHTMIHLRHVHLFSRDLTAAIAWYKRGLREWQPERNSLHCGKLSSSAFSSPLDPRNCPVHTRISDTLAENANIEDSVAERVEFCEKHTFGKHRTESGAGRPIRRDRM
jgi:hypothetical protein